MADHLFIIPGYSDEDFSFIPLRNLLIKQGLYQQDKIKSIEYASMDDQIDFPDFAHKLDREYEKFIEGHHTNTRIDILAHSTGSLVVRSWLYLRRKRQQARNQKLDVPVEHFFLFAPANFGSDLACIGRSSLNSARVSFMKIRDKINAQEESQRKTLRGNQDLFETGRKVLQGLEPASPVQWQLSIGDLHCETYFGPNDPSGQCCYPFVFSAGSPKEKKNIWRKFHFINPLYKDGTDNTIRIAGTSLNTRFLRLRSNQETSHIEWDSELIDKERKSSGFRKFQDIPLAIYKEYDHCGIINGKRTDNHGTEENKPLTAERWLPFEDLKRSLSVKTEGEFSEVADIFKKRTNKYIQSKCKRKKRKRNKGGVYQQFFFKAIDNTGQDIDDFDIDFVVQETETKELAVDETQCIHETLNKAYEIHNHSVDSSNKMLMLGNITDIESRLKELKSGKQVVMIVKAQGPYNGITYGEAEFVIYKPDGSHLNRNDISFFHPFTTTLVEIVLDRIIHNDILSRGDFTIGS